MDRPLPSGIDRSRRQLGERKLENNSFIKDFLNELPNKTSGDLRTDDYTRTLYSTDASIYQVMPHGVFIPKTMEDIHATVELAAKYKVPILPRASGSSLAGQAINEALIIDMTRHLDQILEVNTEEHWVRVQPGVVLDELNLYLRPMGLQFGPDPASSDRAAMGGIISNNSTGSHSIMYGMSADHILETKVILSDGSTANFGPLTDDQLNQHKQKSGLEGTIYQQISAIAANNAATIHDNTPRHWRRCGGYNLDRFINNGVSFLQPQDKRFNLSRLICGAEGTLGIITEIKLNLVPIPPKTALALIHFDSLKEALSSVSVILESEPSTVELLDNLGLTLCRNVPQYARLLQTFIEGQPDCIFITEFYGNSENELQSKIENLKTILKREKVGIGVSVAIDPQAQKNVWTVRKAGLGLLMSIKGDHKPIPFIEDAAVPVEHLSEYVNNIEQFCNDLGTDVAYYAHASAGCLHIRPIVNTKTAAEIAKLPKIVDFTVDLLHGYGGSLSSEHGDGRARSWANERFFGPELYKLYQDIKTTFDPHNILNPGNIVDPLPMTEDLRYGETYTIMPVETHLDFSEEQGFDQAIEMCNGAAICRKKTTGTMCPSFMATREEEHSTRGRANALRAALSGFLPNTEFTSKRMYEVMELCISCKACKSECPSSVDMSKIKFEFLAQYHQANGTPLRSRLFGNIASINRLSGGLTAPLVNFMLQNSLMRIAMDKTLGISKNRAMPTFARQPFTSWYKKNYTPATTNGQKPKIVLFNDTFNTYNYPEILIAATNLFDKMGFDVVLSDHKDCGRPAISKGLVDKARTAAEDTVATLTPFAEQGIPIIGLEPSAILTLRDEYHYLLPDNPHVDKIAELAFTFEEYIAKLADEGKIELDFTDEKRSLLLHGHCQQKALVGTAPSKQILTLPPNYTVEEADSGCCGMAGSFGYESEHYDISMKMAERSLLPAVRAADGETIVVAAGISCREQIKHGTGVRALHPAEVLLNALK
jgi:FAD/FMN-containing dehydrogenase/Fe-S oxidoreductase